MMYGICHALPAILPLVLASLCESGVTVAQMIEPGDLKIEAELRYRSSNQFVFRVARQEVVVVDHRIRAGVPTFVVLAVNYASAVFDDSAAAIPSATRIRPWRMACIAASARHLRESKHRARFPSSLSAFGISNMS